MDVHRIHSLILTIFLAGVCALVRELIRQHFRRNKNK